MNVAQALILIIAANAGAWASARLARGRFSTPLDFGLVLPDGERMLGAHKTWRGLICGALATTLVATSFGLDLRLGFAFGVLALLGDALSSALKRRMRWPPGKEAPFIDQVPESLLPLAMLKSALDVDAVTIAASVLIFIGLDMATARFRRSAPGHS